MASDAMRWRAAAALNLVLPGGGAVCYGALGNGLASGLVFGACANLALLVNLIFPDDFTGGQRIVAVVLTLASYAIAQLAFVAAAQRAADEQRVARRQARLRAMAECSAAGDHVTALHALDALLAEEPGDLGLHRWRVRLLEALGREADLAEAWAELHRLDRHGVYRRAPHGGAGMPTSD
jgi:hypothetical protein